MSGPYTTRNGRTAKKGLFKNGVWHCDCLDRLPADKFQTKKAGPNHGRWFYTCQKPMKPKKEGCGFFLWADEAKVREESAVLSNSRSEPVSVPPKTPQKNTSTALPPTPQTTSTYPKLPPLHKPNVTKDSGSLDNEDSFAWSSSDDDALFQAEQEVLQRTPFETPRKAPRTATMSSPGKRTFNDFSAETSKNDDPWPGSDDVFVTPSTTNKSRMAGLMTPTTTPGKTTQNEAIEAEPSTLASQALQVLAKNNLKLSSNIESELVELLNQHDLRTKGIAKGRDITRVAVQAKEIKIAELQARIATLESEKEMNRRVIGSLKQDILNSPKKGTGRVPPPHRPEL